MQYLAIGIRCLIGVVFLASLGGKVAGRGRLRSFTESVRDLKLLPPVLSRPVSVLVVCAEFVVCGLLAAPAQAVAAAGLVGAAVLLVTFATAISLALRRGVVTSCGCFGPSIAPLGVRQVVRNMVLTVAAVACVAIGPVTAPMAGGTVLAVSTGLVLGGLVAVLDDISELFRPANLKTVGGARGSH